MGGGQTGKLLKICFQLLFDAFLDGIDGGPGAGRIPQEIFIVSLPVGKTREALLVFARVFKGRESSDQKLVGGNYMLQDGFFVLFQKMLFLHLGEKIRFIDLLGEDSDEEVFRGFPDAPSKWRENALGENIVVTDHG